MDVRPLLKRPTPSHWAASKIPLDSELQGPVSAAHPELLTVELESNHGAFDCEKVFNEYSACDLTHLNTHD